MPAFRRQPDPATGHCGMIRLSVQGDAVEIAEHGRVGGHQPEQPRFGVLHRHTGQAVVAHRHIQHDLARDRAAPAACARTPAQQTALHQARTADRFHQQHGPGLGDHPATVAIDTHLLT
jgi:hypothetical protein